METFGLAVRPRSREIPSSSGSDDPPSSSARSSFPTETAMTNGSAGRDERTENSARRLAMVPSSEVRQTIPSVRRPPEALGGGASPSTTERSSWGPGRAR